jgi:hypothetical protein
MKANRDWDRNRLMETTKDNLTELLFLQMRNIWSEDGLYFLGIEKRFGSEVAIDIDREVWSAMGKIEARRLKRMLKLAGGKISDLMEALKHTSWWLDIDDKEFEQDDTRALIRINKCYVQMTREEKGFGKFNCKSVRTGFLKDFAAEFNPKIEVICNFAPLDAHPKDAWCEWEFVLRL